MATIKDIARELNLSHSVVSRALNPNPDSNARVSPKTKALIEETANRFGFRRNRSAEFLKRGRSATIGVFLPEYSNRLIADLMMGISEAAAEDGFPLNFYFGLNYDSYAMFIYNNIRNTSSGIISYPFNIDSSAKIGTLFGEYQKAGGKAVLLNAPPQNDPRLPVIYMDEAAGTLCAAKRLRECDCEIYYVTDGFTVRTDAFIRIMSDCQVRTITAGSLGLELQQVRTGTSRPIGVFATTDEDAMQCLRQIRKTGLLPGRDVLLIGYDDLQLTALTDPPLTTIHQPFRDEGQRAIRKLVSQIYGNIEHDEAVTPFLVQRETA